MALELITSAAFRGLGNLVGRRQGGSTKGSSDLFRILNELQGLTVSVVAGTTAAANIAVQGAAMSVPSSTTLTLTGQVAAKGTLAALSTNAYRISAIDAAGGETTASTEKSVVLTGSQNQVFLTWALVAGAVKYRVYGRVAGSELLMATVTAPSFVDDGSLTPAGALPGSNTAFASQIDTHDTLLSVLMFADAATVVTNLTAEASITSSGNIQCSTTDTSNKQLVVLWFDKASSAGVGLN